METELYQVVKKSTIEELLLHRQRALDEFKKGQEHMIAAEQAAFRAVAHSGTYCYFSLTDRSRTACYASNLSFDEFRKDLDKNFWLYLIESTKIRTAMGRDDIEKFEDQVKTDPPEATPETVWSTLQRLWAGSGDMFRKSVVAMFERLPKEYRTNGNCSLGKRIILEHCFEPKWPSLYYSEWAGRVLYDIEKALCLVGGQEVTAQGKIVPLLSQKISQHKEEAPWEAETELLGAKAFKKGTIHVEFKRQDLVTALNRILAEHYGAALPPIREE